MLPHSAGSANRNVGGASRPAGIRQLMAEGRVPDRTYEQMNKRINWVIEPYVGYKSEGFQKCKGSSVFPGPATSLPAAQRALPRVSVNRVLRFLNCLSQGQ